MDIEGAGFVIGLIGAIWMKSSMNLTRKYQEQPELKMIGREAENPALRPSYEVSPWCSPDLGYETYARLF